MSRFFAALSLLAVAIAIPSAFLLSAGTAAAQGRDGGVDAGPRDAARADGGVSDAARGDTGPLDAAPVSDAGAPDAAPPDAAPPDAGEQGLDAGEEEPLEGEEPVEPYEPVAEQPVTPRTICHGRRIRRIEVRGARRVADEDILATMELRRDVPCTDEEVARDAEALWGMGFFDDLVIDADPVGDDEVDIVVRVAERPAIGRVVYEGNDELDEDDLDEKVTLTEGEVLSVPEVQRQVTIIRDLYAEKGFFLARVTYELRRMGNDEVEVHFAITEGEEVEIRRIRFTGNEHIESSELNGFMRSGETGFFSFLSSSNTFDREAFDEDVVRLNALYYDRGYLTVNVGTPRIELTPDRQHIDISIPIVEGPRFRIGRVSVKEIDEDGVEVEPLGGRRQLREKLEIRTGEWFSRSTIAQNLQDITRAYRDRGYAAVEITPDTDLDPERRIVDVLVSIRRGPLVRIERINIRGNSRTRDSVIRREIQIAEGELYSPTNVEDSKNRITALGYFERVDVSEEEGSTPDRIVLNFEVAEKPTGTFQVGAGFSSIESFIFTAQIQQQNLFGNGQSLTLNLQLSGIRQLIQLRLVEPYLFDTEWTGAGEVFKTIRQFQDFNRDSTGGSFTLGHPVFDPNLRFFLQYKAEYVDISTRTGPLFGAGQGRGFNIFRRLPLANLFQDGLTSSLRLSVTYDTRDNRIFAMEGLYASASSEIADSFLGSNNIFLRHQVFANIYHRLFGSVVIKAHTEWGLITSRNPAGVPVFERFFLGGIFNLRGFNLNDVGPRAGLPLSTDPNALSARQGVSIGGNMQLYYNLELEFPILEAVGIRGVIFTDGGNTWNLEDSLCQAPAAEQFDTAADPCSVNILHLRHSWGFGVRWISPLGPLRFEWGLPFRPRPHEQDIRFDFTIGTFF